LWRHEDVFFNGLGGHIPGFERLDTEEKLLAHLDMGFGGRFLVLPPFMHGAWKTIARERVDQMTLVGDAHALPLLAALREGNHDASSVRVIGSTAAVLSPNVRQELMMLLPEGTMFIESVGATESGLQAMSWNATVSEGLPSYQLREGSAVLSNDRSRFLG